MQTRSVHCIALIVMTLIACASPEPPRTPPSVASAPRVASPSPTESAPRTPAAAVASEASPEAVPAAAPTPSALAAEASSEPAAEERRTRSPIDVLTGPDTAFVINYTGSDPMETARRTCASNADADEEAIAKCLSDARASFTADVLRFRPAGGHWSCTIYKRDGGRLDELFAARVDLSEDSPNRVRLKFSGAEKGVRPVLKAKREAPLEVPNDYSVVINDPELGRLVYEAKIGLVGR